MMFNIAVLVFVLCCIRIAIPRSAGGCSHLELSSSITERHACLSEEVTFTCTARGTAIFWGNEAFVEITMHYQSSPSRGQFRAEVVSYDRTQNCLISSLRFRATDSLNGSRVTCTNRDRSLYRSFSLHIMNITLENLTVVPVSLSTVLLRWNINPTNGHHCIVNFSIQVSGEYESPWRAQTPGNNNSFLLTEMQLTPWKEYTYCITANTIHPNQAGPTVKQKSTVELHEPNPPTNLSALSICGQDYKIQVDWQAPFSNSTPLASPVIGYLLYYITQNNAATVQLPVNITSHTLNNVTACTFHNITVLALSNVGASKNNPSVQFGPQSSFCDDKSANPVSGKPSLTPFFTQTLTAVEGTDNLCMAPPYSCNECMGSMEVNSSTPSSNQSCPESPTKSESCVTLCTTIALIAGVIAFGSGILLAVVCNILYIQQWKIPRKHHKDPKHTVAVFPLSQQQHQDESPEYEEIPNLTGTRNSDSQDFVELQQNTAYASQLRVH